MLQFVSEVVMRNGAAMSQDEEAKEAGEKRFTCGREKGGKLKQVLRQSRVASDMRWEVRAVGASLLRNGRKRDGDAGGGGPRPTSTPCQSPLSATRTLFILPGPPSTAIPCVT